MIAAHVGLDTNPNNTIITSLRKYQTLPIHYELSKAWRNPAVKRQINQIMIKTWI